MPRAVVLQAGFSLALLAGCSGPTPQTVDVVPSAATCASPDDVRCGGVGTCGADLQASHDHCGRCDNACDVGAVCLAGKCEVSRRISSFDHHTCALEPTGVVCWGDGLARRLDGPWIVPVRIPSMQGDDFTSVVANASGVCAARASGAVQCADLGEDWTPPPLSGPIVSYAYGYGGFCAALGSGHVECAGVIQRRSGSETVLLEPLPELEDATFLTSAGRDFCAVHAHGEVLCWSYELRKAEYVKPVEGLTDALKVSAYGSASTESCALRKTGQVACWGLNVRPTNDRNAPANTPFDGLNDAIDVAVGEGHGCAVRANGAVVCWGSDHPGNRGAVRGVLREIVGVTDAIGISAGDGFSCAARRSGRPVCWGSTEKGQLGNGVVPDIDTPTQVPALSGATALAVTRNATCALDASGAVKCLGALGFDDALRKEKLAPRTVGTVKDATTLVALDDHVCAPRSSGEITCWGWHGDTERAVSMGGAVTLARGSWGRLAVVFASGEVGAIDPLSLVDPTPVVRVETLKDVVDVAVTFSTVCAIRRNGHIACAKVSLSDQPYSHGAVVEVPNVTDAVALRSAMTGYCFLRTNGAQACFDARDIELGKAPTVGTEVATGVGAVRSWGGGLALLEDGTVQSITQANGMSGTPPVVRTLPLSLPATAIGASSHHRCALLNDGTVSCWGQNRCQQISPSPRAVEFDAVEVSATSAE